MGGGRFLSARYPCTTAHTARLLLSNSNPDVPEPVDVHHRFLRRVPDLVFGFRTLGFRVQGSGFGVRDLVSGRVWGLGFKFLVLGFMV